MDNYHIGQTEDIINLGSPTKQDTAAAQVLALLAIATAIGNLADQAQNLAEQVQDLVSIANLTTYTLTHGGPDAQDA
jgi:uncharacterized protein with PhoU and TrkA domain